jgi:hypothetical protein
MNGICSRLSVLSTERPMIVVDSSQILAKRLRRKPFGEDARRLINCCDCSNVVQCNNYEMFNIMNSIKESARRFQDLKNSKRATLIEFPQSLVC